MISFIITIIRLIVKHLEHLGHYKSSMKPSISYISIFNNLLSNNIFLAIYKHSLSIFIYYQGNS